MAFQEEPSITAASIGRNRLILDDAGPGARSATIEVEVHMSDGSVRIRRYNAVGILSAPIINGFLQVMTEIRALGEAEILPRNQA